MLKYFWIFIAIALVVMPVFWLMPSPAQKRQASLRQKALQLGLHIKVCNLPQTHRATVRREVPRKGVAYQLVLAGKEGQSLKSSNLLQRDDAGLEFSGDNQLLEAELRSAFDRCPNSVHSLEITPTALTAYWQETADDVDTIKSILDHLRTRLQHIYPTEKS